MSNASKTGNKIYQHRLYTILSLIISVINPKIEDIISVWTVIETGSKNTELYQDFFYIQGNHFEVVVCNKGTQLVSEY